MGEVIDVNFQAGRRVSEGHVMATLEELIPPVATEMVRLYGTPAMQRQLADFVASVEAELAGNEGTISLRSRKVISEHLQEMFDALYLE